MLMLMRQALIEAVDLGEQQLSGSPSEQLSGLADGRERNRRGSGEDDVVVADDRDVVRDSNAMRDESLQQADGEQIVRGERGRRPFGRWHQGDLTGFRVQRCGEDVLGNLVQASAGRSQPGRQAAGAASGNSHGVVSPSPPRRYEWAAPLPRCGFSPG